MRMEAAGWGENGGCGQCGENGGWRLAVRREAAGNGVRVRVRGDGSGLWDGKTKYQKRKGGIRATTDGR